MAERILYYDCFAGISGDMHLAALVDLGVPEAYLTAELNRLNLDGWALALSSASKMGISGTRADVTLTPVPRQRSRLIKNPAARALHEHRLYKDITLLIHNSSLSEAVKKRSLDIFERIAQAESKIHGVPLSNVGFHEVGAVDSIIDIVGAAICIDFLKPDRIMASSVELGGGFVMCAHGKFPVPAPATTEILREVPVKTGIVPFEMTTPTGAAILAASVDQFTDQTQFSIQKIGYGIGHRDVAIPNVLRVFLAHTTEKAPHSNSSKEIVIECNLDDMSGEIAGSLMENLFQAGAKDAWYTPIIMKKSRPAVMLSVLCAEADKPSLSDLILKETTSFGLRSFSADKIALERSTVSFASSLGPVKVKTAFYRGKALKSKPEYQDCQTIAQHTGIPLKDVLLTVQTEIENARLSGKDFGQEQVQGE